VQVPSSYNFASLINDFLTEEFARVVRFDVVMWVIAIVWLCFPEGSYGGFWMTGAMMLASLIAGAKLHSVAMHLARHAYSRYYQPLAQKPRSRSTKGWAQSAHNLLLKRSRPTTPGAPVAEGRHMPAAWSVRTMHAPHA
jgi:Mlo family